MSDHIPAANEARHHPHRRRKRAHRSGYTLLWRVLGVVLLIGIFVGLWHWNRKAQSTTPSPLEDTSISRPG